MLFCPFPEGSYRVTQRFGERPEYYAKYNMIGHNGQDFGPPVPGQTGVAVYAPHDGYAQVLNDGDVGYGLHVEILALPHTKDGKRRKSTLAHLDRVFVHGGQLVNQGDAVGIMGTTGDSTGVHTHWTYKVADRSGKTLNHGNGYLGAVDVAKFVRLWLPKTLG